MPRRPGRPDIPSTLERSDKHAQDIYQKAHDSAVETYGEGEHAHRVAFAALKHEYRKEGDRWVKKALPGPSDPQAARGYNPHSTARTAGGHVIGLEKSRDELYQEAKQLEVKGRSSMSKEELAEAVVAAQAKK